MGSCSVPSDQVWGPHFVPGDPVWGPNSVPSDPVWGPTSARIGIFLLKFLHFWAKIENFTYTMLISSERAFIRQKILFRCRVPLNNESKSVLT